MDMKKAMLPSKIPNRVEMDSNSVHLLLEQYRKTKDPRIQEQIVKQCMGLVKKIASSIARRSTDAVDDLIQVGYIGLIKAIENFDPTAGAKCTTYFTHLIAGEMRHYCRDKSMLFRAPRELVELNFRINKMINALTSEFGREPTDYELAQALEVDTKKIHEAFEVERRRTLISLDQSITSENNSDDQIFMDTLIDSKYQQMMSLQEHRFILQEALVNITPQSREIIEEIFLREQTQSSYAKKYRISQMQTSRRLRSALAELRRYFYKIGQHNSPV